MKKRSQRYLEEFVMCKCAPDLLMHKLYPNAKEITEAIGMFKAGFGHFNSAKLGEKGVAIVVGDGNTPRLGAMIAYRTNWDVITIDPRFKSMRWGEEIDRLNMIKGKIGDNTSHFKSVPGFFRDRSVILFMPHSHADMNEAVDCIPEGYKSLRIVSMPCCVPIPEPWCARPHKTYRDVWVQSPQNEIHIWEVK